MADKSRTSKQKNRDNAEEAAVGDLFATSFDEIESADTPAANGPETTEDESPEPEKVDDSETTEEQSEEVTEEVAEDTTGEEQPGGAPAKGPPSSGPPSSGPPSSGPPSSGPPSSGPPSSGPPSSGPPSSGPPSSGPPSSGPPPSGPPSSGPPSKGPPTSGPPSKGPPSKGPPSKGPPSKGPPSSGPPKEKEVESKDDNDDDDAKDEDDADTKEGDDDEFNEELLASVTHSAGEKSQSTEESSSEESGDNEAESGAGKADEDSAEKVGAEESDEISDAERLKQLESEVERLRGGLAGAAEVIQELEEPPLPPIVGEDFVIPSHLVSDFVRIGRQLHREGLVRAMQGAVAILDPDQPGLMHATAKSCALGQMSELDIVSGRLGQAAPVAAPADWRVMEILIAATSLHNGGPAACIHVQPPYATTVAMEKDRIVLQPIDHYGKENLGKAVIVIPDLDDMDEYLRQVAEALQQGNMKCVVIQGLGVFAVGRNFTEAWHWAATLESSMQVLLLARQAGLKT